MQGIYRRETSDDHTVRSNIKCTSECVCWAHLRTPRTPGLHPEGGGNAAPAAGRLPRILKQEEEEEGEKFREEQEGGDSGVKV